MFKRSMKLFITQSLLILVIFSFAIAGELKVLAPIDGENVKSKDIIIIGKVSSDVKSVEVKGVSNEPVKANVVNGGFFAKVQLKNDDNKVTVSASDGSSVELNLKVNASSGFSYHPDSDEVLDCSSCHASPEKNGYAIQPAAPVCFECHDHNDDKKFVHGPVNMGICVVCHLPHGSDVTMFLRMDKKNLCSGCHSDLMSSHPSSDNKECVECHDPHSSDKEFHVK